VSFLSYFLLGELEKCLEILLAAGRIPEAAFFARTYLPSQVSRVVSLWRVQLGKVSEKAGQSLADPADYPNLFPDFQASLQAEAMLRKERGQAIPAPDYQEIVVRRTSNFSFDFD
jgi:coatomer subunit beta'